MKIRLLLHSLFFCVLFSSAPHATNSPLKVGIAFFDPPFIFSPSEGFDIDLINRVCAGLQRRCQLIPMSHRQLFTAVSSGQVDLAIDAIFINPSPNYIFSIPYLIGKGQFLILKNSPVRSVADLQGKRIGVIKGNPEGGAFENYLTQTYPGQFIITDYSSVNDLITALSARRVDAVFLRRSSVVYWTQNADRQFQSLGAVVTVGVAGMGVMSSPNNVALIQQVNVELQKMEKDNFYLTLYNTYLNAE